MQSKGKKQGFPPRVECTGLSELSGVSGTELLKALSAGDEATFRAFFDHYQGKMLHIALRYVADTETAADVVQETWLAVIRGVQRFEGRSSFQTWLFTILMNRARTRCKREKRQIPFSALQTAAGEMEREEEIIDTIDASWRSKSIQPRVMLLSITRSPEDITLTNELWRYLDLAIEQLPKQQRQVIKLHDLEGWTTEEISHLLHLSAGNQRVLLCRARVKVRRMLLNYLEQLV